MQHLVIAPLLMPFAAGVLLLAMSNAGWPLQRTIALLAAAGQVIVAMALLGAVSAGDLLVYRLGDWPAPWGIVLVADRLAAWMVLMTSVLALLVLVAASGGIDQRGRHFHPLLQMQIFGLCGAFLTGDLFNLFVFFEVLLIASYGLVLHGGGAQRTRSGLHYVVMNLAGSALFLFAAGLIYASLGSLNLADMAERVRQIAPENVALARTGGLLLLVVFGLKAALLPLHLWLPGAYADTSAPVAALFAIMTKVGLYAIVRCHTLLFGDSAGALAHLYDSWLLPLALATLAVGAAGALAATHLGRLAGYLILVSVGTLLTGFALGSDGMAGALYYLPHSTFTAGALFLVADVIRRQRTQGDALVADADLPQKALVGALFFVTVVASAGLPPLSGFLGKWLILRAAVAQPWVLSVVLASALLVLVALAQAGSNLFFAGKPAERTDAPQSMHLAASFSPVGLTRSDTLALGGLLGMVLALTVAAGPAFEFTQATADQLLQPDLYIRAVLGAKP